MNFECDICETTFENEADLITHFPSFHTTSNEKRDKTFCHLCDRTYSRLKQHKRRVHDKI